MQNRIKKKLQDGKAIIGTIPTIDHPTTLRALAASDFVFFLIDTQHSQIDITTLYKMLTDLGRSRRGHRPRAVQRDVSRQCRPPTRGRTASSCH